MQIPRVDFTNFFSSVASDTAIRVLPGVFLYYQKHCPSDNGNWEAAFLNADLDMKCFIEWPEGMQESGSITANKKQQYCIELKRALYGDTDAPLQWMKIFTRYLKELQLQQSKIDPCILYMSMTRKEN
jgi:Reverse transcriptase (RNA-dependent DNA polymerase)